jgi:hypothetical protein
LTATCVVALLLALATGCTQDFTGSAPTGEGPINTDPRPIGLETPALTIGVGIETGELYLHWTSIPGASQYTLESDYDSLFFVPMQVLRGPTLSIHVEPDPMGFDQYFRVRAETEYLRSTWSNVIKVSGGRR